MTEHSEVILNVRSLDCSSPSRTRSTLFNDKASKWAKAKVCVFVDSVLCVDRIEQAPGAADAKGTGQIEDLKRYSSYQDAVGLDGEAIEFEWKNLKDLQHWLFFRRSRKTWRRTWSRRIWKTGSSSCLCSTTSDWKKNDENCISNAERVKNCAKRFLPGHWTFLGPRSEKGSEERWYGSSSYAQKGEWESTANKMVQQFKETGHFIFTSTVLWVEGSWSREKVKVPFTSMEILWIRNSCFKQFILWTKSVFNSLWQKEKNKSLFPWTMELWPWWNPKKWKCWYLFLIKHWETRCSAARKLPNKGKECTLDTIMWKNLIPVSCHSRESLPNSTKWRRRIERNHSFMPRMCDFSSLSEN